MAAVPPAEPNLASALVDNQELESTVERVFLGRKKTGKPDVIHTGVSSVNEALEGGLERGRMVGVSGEVGAGSSDICTALLVSSLLQDTTTAAAVVDATGNFDIVRVYTLIASRLQQDEQLLQSLRTADLCDNSEPSIEDVAAKVLDRLKIMRVFDLIGVMEAIGEIRDGLEGRTTKKEASPIVASPMRDVDEETGDIREADEEPQLIDSAAEDRIIADSQEDEDEMLFDSEMATQPVPLATQDLPIREQHMSRPSVAEVQADAPNVETAAKPDPTPVPQPLSETNEPAETPPLKVSFILIDSLAQVLSPFLKKDHTKANDLLTAQLRSLSHLTSSHSILTLLLNPATVPRPRSPTRKTSGPPPPQQVPNPPPSIFSDVKAVPALGNILGVYVDTVLMVSKVPRRKVDARVLYSEGHNKKAVQWVNVVEVLSDRWGGRTGGWGTFVVDQEKGVKDL